MKKTVITTSQVMADLLAEYDYLPLLPDDITAARLSAKSHHRHAYWITLLEARVKAGTLIKIMRYNPDTKRPITAYRPKAKA